MFYNIKISLFFEGSRLMDGRAAKKIGRNACLWHT